MLPQLEAHVGNVQNNTIDEIWNGAAIKILRDALAAYEFGPGCEFCEFRTTEANFSNTAMSRFDHFDVESENPTWPQQFEFSFSNSCNLECIMCTGLYSSAIRARREKLPPQPKMYPDDFVDSLRKYLPHLRLMKFLGGEPFLIKEHYRIWEMMIEDGLSVHCHVTTNGTQYNKRIARIMDRVPMAFSISLDGTSRKTLESIRVNANYDEVMENTARFRSYARERKTSFGLTFCLMRQNWHEFGDYCLMADAWDCGVYVNTVTDPPQFGIYTLPNDELRKILHSLEAQAPRLESLLKRNKNVWFGELDRIRKKCRTPEPISRGGTTSSQRLRTEFTADA